MPPAAATECERTGWTLDMMATVAPASAAASAARCPASPAPMISTSWEGMGRDLIRREAAGRAGPGTRGAVLARTRGQAARGLVERGRARVVADGRGARRRQLGRGQPE